MDNFKLYKAVGEIDDSLLLEAESAWERGNVKRVRFPAARWAALAACLLLITAAVLCWPRQGGVQLPADGTANGGNQSGGGTVQPVVPPAAVKLAFNEVAAAPVGGSSVNDVTSPPVGVTAMVSLDTEDFVPMTYEEVQDYFGVTLPAEEDLSGMTLTGGGCFGDGFGVYRTGERGTYYDINAFSFSDAAGAKSLDISLRTMFIMNPSSLDIAAGPEKIVTTRIKGWDLALFRYAGNGGYYGEEGRIYCHTQFLQDGVAWGVTASGLTEKELARVLEAILPEKTAVDGPRTASGTVSWVDDRHEDYFDGQEHHYTEGHDFIQVELDSGERFTVWIPGQANQYAKGDRVTVTYTGEPATISNLWPGQVESVVKE